jgi:hypothetical protein
MGGQTSRRQRQASKRHDAGAALATQVANGQRQFEEKSDNCWEMNADIGDEKYTITREGCKRICAVCFLSVNRNVLRLPAKDAGFVRMNSSAIVPTL